MLHNYCPAELREFYTKLQLLPKHRLCGHTQSCLASVMQVSFSQVLLQEQYITIKYVLYKEVKHIFCASNDIFTIKQH